MKRPSLIIVSSFLAIFTGQLLMAMNCHSEGRMPDSFVDVKEQIPSILLDIRYYGPHNFIGERIEGYNAPACLLTREAAAALAGKVCPAAGCSMRATCSGLASAR